MGSGPTPLDSGVHDKRRKGDDRDCRRRMQAGALAAALAAIGRGSLAVIGVMVLRGLRLIRNFALAHAVARHPRHILHGIRSCGLPGLGSDAMFQMHTRTRRRHAIEGECEAQQQAQHQG